MKQEVSEETGRLEKCTGGVQEAQIVSKFKVMKMSINSPHTKESMAEIRHNVNVLFLQIYHKKVHLH